MPLSRVILDELNSKHGYIFTHNDDNFASKEISDGITICFWFEEKSVFKEKFEVVFIGCKISNSLSKNNKKTIIEILKKLQIDAYKIKKKGEVFWRVLKNDEDGSSANVKKITDAILELEIQIKNVVQIEENNEADDIEEDDDEVTDDDEQKDDSDSDEEDDNEEDEDEDEDDDDDDEEYIDVKEKSKGITFLLWLPPMGIFGAHKYYLGRKRMGIAYSCTFGFIFLGWLFDMFTLFPQVDVANGILDDEDAGFSAGIKKIGSILFKILKIMGKILFFALIVLGSGSRSSSRRSTSRSKSSSGGVYYCRDCGASGTQEGLRTGTCRVNSSGRHRPYVKPGKAGGSSGVCYCKDCGGSGTFAGLRSGTCYKSPTGRHRPYRKYHG